MSETPDPVFILAAPCCGASFVAASLGCHPQLHATPELNLFMARDLGELLEVFRLSQGPAADGLLRVAAQLMFGQQGNAQIAQAREWLRQNSQLAVGAVLREIAAATGGRGLVVPDTETPMRPSDIARLHAQLPNARFLHLTRHPYTQGILMSESLQERLFVPSDYRDHSLDPAPVEPQLPWLRANHNILSWVKPGRESRYLHVTFESVENEPQASLRRICEWLGVATDERAIDAMRACENWIYWGFGPTAAPYGLEPEALEEFSAAALEEAYDAPSLKKTLPWKPEPSGFAAKVSALAAEMGYQ